MPEKVKKELCIDYDKLLEIENDIRDLNNWLKTFETLHDLDPEIVSTLHERFDALAKKIADAKVLK